MTGLKRSARYRGAWPCRQRYIHQVINRDHGSIQECKEGGGATSQPRYVSTLLLPHFPSHWFPSRSICTPFALTLIPSRPSLPSQPRGSHLGGLVYSPPVLELSGGRGISGSRTSVVCPRHCLYSWKSPRDSICPWANAWIYVYMLILLLVLICMHYRELYV